MDNTIKDPTNNNTPSLDAIVAAMLKEGKLILKTLTILSNEFIRNWNIC